MSVRCRFCGLEPDDTKCQYNEGISGSATHGHVYVNHEHPAYKEAPYTQYAATWDAYGQIKMCERCGELMRMGQDIRERWNWYTEATKREHGRTCG